MKIRFFLFALIVVGFACQRPTDPGIEMVDVNGSLTPKINVEQIENEGVIRFTDWFEDIRLVELETTENSLIFC